MGDDKPGLIMDECMNWGESSQLECRKSRTLVLGLLELLEEHVNKPLVLSDFKYYHDEALYHEIRNDSVSNKCFIDSTAQYCHYNCTDIVLNEAIMLQKGSRNIQLFMKNLLDGNIIEIMEISKSLGIDILKNASYMYSQAVHLLNNPNFKLEAGGGSGVGFQLYCDNKFNLTLGFGGGGGLDYSLDRFSYGGGFGGGLQFVEYDSTTMFNVGGGGGCGTKENSNQLICGSSIDTNVYDNVTYLITKLKNLYLQCGSILIRGGGGGGGGSSECCDPFMTGFGYSFTIISSNMTSSLANSLNQSNSSKNSEYQDFIYSPTTVGTLLSICSTSCNGYGNWTCIQSMALENIALCGRIDSAYCNDVLRDYGAGHLGWLLNPPNNNAGTQNESEFNYYTNATSTYTVDMAQLRCDSNPSYESNNIYNVTILQNVFLSTMIVVLLTQCVVVACRYGCDRQSVKNSGLKRYHYGGININLFM